MNPGGGGGTYVKRSLTVAPGDVMTFCAGSGGLGGGACEGADTFCCCGQRGNCSYVKRNGNFCADAWGGMYGMSDCYMECGCFAGGCGNGFTISGSPCGANGTWAGCTGYTADIIGGPGSAFTQGCLNNGWAQATVGAGTTFGGEHQHGLGNGTCWGYWRFKTTCTNSSGVAGPGGDGVSPTSTASAYNTPGSANYVCSGSTFWGCTRGNIGQVGNFPGGGGVSGTTPCCCYYHSPGSNGAPGYVRVWW